MTDASHAPVAIAPLQHPSTNVLDASDLQYMLGTLMQAQLDNGGMLFLRGECLTEAAQSQAGLRDQGPGFCLAGKVAIVTKMASDGPALFINFKVPSELCCQKKQYNAASRHYDAVSGPAKLDPTALQVEFPGHEVRERLMTKPSPMRPAINQ